MTATTHALIAGFIASSVPNPEIGLPMVAFSHPILDMIPHWDFGIGWRKKTKFKLFIESFFDLWVGVLITYLIFAKTTDHLYLFAAIFLSEIWDLMLIPYLLFNWKFFPFSTFYDFGHKTNRHAKLPWGIITQIASVALVALFFRLVR